MVPANSLQFSALEIFFRAEIGVGELFKFNISGDRPSRVYPASSSEIRAGGAAIDHAGGAGGGAGEGCRSGL